MTTVYRYRMWCEIEHVFVFVWGDADNIPTRCPNDPSHHIVDPVVVAIVEEQNIRVKEETVPTGGNFMTETIKFVVPPSTTTTVTKSFPFPITAMLLKTTTTDVHMGDLITLAVGKDTIVGAITANLSPATSWASQNYVVGDKVVFLGKYYTCHQNTVANNSPISPSTGRINLDYWSAGYQIPVSSTVTENVKIGYYVKLDGILANPSGSIESLNRVLSVDRSNCYIYMETGPTNSYTASPPTYVRQTVYYLKDYEFGYATHHKVGESKIGGSSIPINTVIEGTYTNQSTTDTKTLVTVIEYLY